MQQPRQGRGSLHAASCWPTAGAEIGADHIRIRCTSAGVPSAILRAAVQHGDAVGDVHDHRHVVLDQDDRGAPLRVHFEDEARHVLFLALVHAAHRFVEQQHLGFQRQRAAKLDALAQPVGQRGRRLLADVLQFEEVDQFLDAGTVGQFFLLREAPVDERRQHAGAHVHVPTEHDVVEHGHAREQRDVLEGARDAECGDRGGTRVRDVAAFQRDGPAGRAIEARDHVEQRRLAGAVRTDDRHDLAATDGHRHVFNRAHATEVFRHAGDGKQRLIGRNHRRADTVGCHDAAILPV